MAIEKYYVQDVAKCNSLKEKTIVYNKFRLLNGVAKKGGVLQNVMLCGGMRGKKIRPFLQRPDFILHAVYRLWFCESLSSTNGGLITPWNKRTDFVSVFRLLQFGFQHDFPPIPKPQKRCLYALC